MLRGGMAAVFPAAAADSDFSADDDEKLPPARPPSNSIRVVGADGAVRVYECPVSAAEVMTDNPCHLVCRADAAFTIGQKVPALSAADRLLPGHSYFLLPSHFFHSVLSFVSLASSLLLAGGPATATATATAAAKSPTGALQIIVCDQLLMNSDKNTMKPSAAEEKEKEMTSSCGSSSRVCTDEALEKEYREMVKARRERRWTPKLATIGEKCETERSKNWWKRGVLASLGTGRTHDFALGNELVNLSHGGWRVCLRCEPTTLPSTSTEHEVELRPPYGLKSPSSPCAA
ncbi:hypothetical protein ACMD2_25101 [Ananas comosus]|uniref:Uncharacterized protein n=1 Tax=Ananas comosus TaxID=4615 RepID=A0A199VI47_ANACO|nr:hypothetical protein ACMD2_25101 [Ananas comosus]